MQIFLKPTRAVLFIALMGCSKKPHEQIDASGAPSARASASASASVDRQVTAPLPGNPRDFDALFRVEAAARPTGTIRVEDVLAAFAHAGIDVPDAKQHLGRPFGARYCVGGTASKRIAISICEYLDKEAAQAGAASSRQIVLANREVRVNQATSLTTRELEKNADSDALASKLFETFAKLH